MSNFNSRSRPAHLRPLTHSLLYTRCSLLVVRVILNLREQPNNKSKQPQQQQLYNQQHYANASNMYAQPYAMMNPYYAQVITALVSSLVVLVMTKPTRCFGLVCRNFTWAIRRRQARRALALTLTGSLVDFVVCVHRVYAAASLPVFCSLDDIDSQFSWQQYGMNPVRILLFCSPMRCRCVIFRIA
jgi:hypothetical protein